MSEIKPGQNEFLFREIDNLKANLEALEHKNRQLESELQQVKEKSWSGTWEMDLKTKTVSWSDEMYLILGLKKEGVKPDMKIFNEMLPPISRDKLNGAIRKCFLTKADYSFEHIIDRKDSNPLSVRTDLKMVLSDQGAPLKLVGVTNDITSIKSAQQELEKLSLIASKTSNAVLVTDIGSKVEWVNEGFVRLFGFRSDEIIGRKFKELLKDPDISIGDSNYVFKALNQYHAINEESILLSKKGQEIWSLINMTPILDYELNPEKYIVILTDITIQKQNEEQLKLQKKEISGQRDLLKDMNTELSETLDELTRAKISRTSILYSFGTLILLVILTEVFLDPVIDTYTSNNYLSLLVKIGIALLLKPVESFYERILIKRVMSKKANHK